jgi:hypothetical protein
MKKYCKYALLGCLILFSGFTVSAQDIEVTFAGELSGDPGEDVALSVDVSNLTGLNINNFDIAFSFDSELIRFEAEDIAPGDLINSLTANVTDDDRVLISYASSSPIEGSGTLFKITGRLTGEGVNGSGLTITELFFGDGSLNVIPSVPHNITVRSGDDSSTLFPPSLLSPQNAATDIPTDPVFEWTSEPEAESYRLIVARDAGFNYIVVDSSGILSNTFQLADLDYHQIYYWRVQSELNTESSDWAAVFNFTTRMVTSRESQNDISQRPSLDQNYPNPFNPSTTVTYSLSQTTNVTIDVQNLTGQTVAILFEGQKRAGTHSIAFDASNLSSGVYVYRLQAGEFVQTRTLTLIK